LNGKVNNGSLGFYQVDMQTGEAKLLMPNTHGAQAGGPWLSPDGKMVVYLVIDQSILVRNLESGEERTLYQAAQSPRLKPGFSVSPDNQQVAFSLYSDFKNQEFATIQIFPIAGGGTGKSFQVKVPLTTSFQQEIGATWSPDGRSLFFLLRPNWKSLCELWQISIADGKARRLELAIEGLQEIDLHPDGQQVAFGLLTRGGGIWVMENFLQAVQARKTSVSRR
jgi:Tol biopolymer transport system component